MYYATAKEMETLDKLAVESGLEIGQMMELAGWHMLSVMQKVGIAKDASITIVVGKGNKGGDGLSAARHLADQGRNVGIVLADRKLSGDSEHHLRLLTKMKIPIVIYPEEKEKAKSTIQESDVLIDALIGYHLEGAPKGVFKELIEEMNGSGKKIIAYDLPSGVEPTTGECLEPCILASATLSLAMPKKLFEAEEGRRVSGRVFIADIGIPSFLYDSIHPGSRPEFEASEDSLIAL